MIISGIRRWQQLVKCNNKEESKHMEIYFDNAATTAVLPEVKDIMLETLDKDYGNPSSKHLKGVAAERYVSSARKNIAKIFKCESKEIYFTSGGTESNNIAIRGICEANKREGNHIITSRIEHASVYNPILYMEQNGYRVSFLDVDSKGIVNIRQLEELLGDDTVLVSVMAVNNEIGTVEPIKEISDVIQTFNKKNNKKVHFHVDAVQAFGKQIIYPGRMGIDAMSVSGHKIHGPKGSGALYVRNNVKIKPLVYGGGQEKDMRSGTENTTAIAGMGKAVELAYERLDQNCLIMDKVKKCLIQGAVSIDGVTDNSGDAPHIASLSFSGVKSEVLLHALEDKGIYVSSGSACSSNHPAVSGVLKAIGQADELLDSTLRFSFCELNSVREAEYTVDVLKEIVPMLRKYTRK